MRRKSDLLRKTNSRRAEICGEGESGVSRFFNKTKPQWAELFARKAQFSWKGKWLPPPLSLSMLEAEPNGVAKIHEGVSKALFRDRQTGRRYLIKTYQLRHSELLDDAEHPENPALYEFLGQAIARRAGLAASHCFLLKENPFAVCTEEPELNPEQIKVSVYDFGLHAANPADVVDFLQQALGERDTALKILLLDALLHNKTRHMEKLFLMAETNSRKALRLCPLTDTLAFGTSGSAPVVRVEVREHYPIGTASGLTHKQLARTLAWQGGALNVRACLAKHMNASLEVIEEARSLGLLTEQEVSCVVRLLWSTLTNMTSALQT